MVEPDNVPVGPQIDENPTAAAGGSGHFLRDLIRETVQILAPALILALLVHLFLAQATVVYGQSMEPNLHPNQRLIVEKFSYRLRAPARDDIVVVDRPDMEEMLVKRVVALPGESVEIRRGTVYVNGEPVPESYPHDTTAYDMPPVRLGPLAYFVMGDNRSNSNDSRSFGPIQRDEIVGRVWLRYWPFGQFHLF